MNKTNDHVAIILAAGESRRLGQPKQLLKKQGMPLICIALQQALATDPMSVIIVVPMTVPLVKKTVLTYIKQLSDAKASIIQLIDNKYPSHGMANSLSLAIDNFRLQSNIVKHALIMTVDQILLNDSHLSTLLITKSKDKSVQVVASKYPKQGGDALSTEQQLGSLPQLTGIPLVIKGSLLRQWQAKLSGDKGLRTLIRTLPADQLVSVTSSKLYYDIDTPQQLVYARQHGWLDN